jgi:site-specific DNA-methyltransferase (adenine-specific)
MKEMINKVFNEDCLETMKRMEDKSVNLIIADFPYFEVKGDFDFIWKDFDEFLDWIEVCAKEFKRILSDNGSLYVYGHAKKIAYKQVIFDKYFNIENNLKWYKTDCQTRIGFEGFNSYPPVTEHILFYSNEILMTGLEAIEAEFIKPKNPFSLYLKSEFKKAKVTNKKISSLFPSKTGGLTGRVSNWLNGDNIITKEQYLKVREFLNNEYLLKPYEDLRQEYEDLRQEYEDLRRPFDNRYRHDDVLMYAQEVHITGKYNHPTQKPPKLSRALIETSTNKDSLVYIPFGGGGGEAEQCQILGLDWITGDLEKEYCEIIEDRVKNAKGEVGLFSSELIQGSLF